MVTIFFWYRKLLHSFKVMTEYNKDSFSDFILFQLALFPSLIIWHKYWLFYIFAGSLALETSFLLPCPLLKHLKGAVFQFPGWGKPLSGPILRAVSTREEEPDFLDSNKYNSSCWRCSCVQVVAMCREMTGIALLIQINLLNSSTPDHSFLFPGPIKGLFPRLFEPVCHSAPFWYPTI